MYRTCINPLTGIPGDKHAVPGKAVHFPDRTEFHQVAVLESPLSLELELPHAVDVRFDSRGMSLLKTDNIIGSDESRQSKSSYFSFAFNDIQRFGAVKDGAFACLLAFVCVCVYLFVCLLVCLFVCYLF
jgi:hypothetical protein